MVTALKEESHFIKTKLYPFRHCICRRDGCDHGDMCQKNSDCGRDKWNRQGKCVIRMRPDNGGFVIGDMILTVGQYESMYGLSHWKKNK